MMVGQYRAAGNTVARGSFPHKGMRIRGKFFDEIHMLTETLEDCWEGRSGVPQTAFAEENAEAVQSPYGTQQKTFTAIWRTFTRMATVDDHWSTARQHGGPVSAHPEYFICMWGSATYEVDILPEHKLWVDRHRDFLIHGKSLQEWATSMKWSYRRLLSLLEGRRMRYMARSRKRDKQAFSSDLWHTLQQNMRFTTTRRGFIGWAHPEAQQGDQIYLFSGCSVPVILRSTTGGRFNVVGDAYVHGCMNGEGIEQDDDDQWTDVDIY